MTAFQVNVLLVLVVLVLLQGCDGGESDKCPPWHFTPANATTPCSGCSLPHATYFYCSTRSGLVDVSFIISEHDDSLFVGKVLFELDRTKWLLQAQNYHQTFQSWKTSFAVATKDKDFFVVNVSQAVGLPFTPTMVYPVNVLATVMEYQSTSYLKFGPLLFSLLFWWWLISQQTQ